MTFHDMENACTQAAIQYANEVHGAGFLPREFYFRLRLNCHTSWPVFRSTSLPTFPGQMIRKNKTNNNTSK